MRRYSFYTLASLLVAGIAITACTSDDLTEGLAVDTAAKTYTLSVNATKGADTRTLTEETDGSLTAVWNTTDVVAVYKGENKVGELTPDAATATAKLKGEVTGVAVDDELTLKFGTLDNYASQEGTLDFIDTNCIYAEATVTVTEIVGNAVNTSDAEFEYKQAIVKITLKDKFGNSTAKTAAQAAVGDAVYPDGSFYTVDNTSSTALSVENLIIKNAETNEVITTVTLKSAASEVYFAFAPCSKLSLKFETTVNDLTYKAYVNVTVEAGKFYQSTLNLSAAEAVVVYKSTDLSKDILAYALEDACEPLPWDPDNINTWVANHPVTGGTWRLPTIDDFRYMFEGCGGTSYTASTSEGVSYDYGTLQSLITAAGGKEVTDKSDLGYWSSTEKSSNAYAFFFFESDNKTEGQFWAMYKSSYWYYYRACLAINNDGYTDLSAEATANTYMVTAKGKYKFNAMVKGNGGIDPVTGTTANAITGIAGVKVLWELYEQGRAIKYDGTAYDIFYNDGYVYFSTPDEFTSGDAYVAVYDSEGIILWSWLIWATPEVGTIVKKDYTYMDINLGGIAVGNYSRGFCYQWGRKDPFSAANGGYTPYDYAPERTTVFSFYKGGLTDVEYTVQNPTTYIMSGTNLHWITEEAYTSDLWYASGKSIYDPCPAGWKVPSKDEAAGYKELGLPGTGFIGDCSSDFGYGNPGTGYYWTSTSTGWSQVWGFYNDRREIVEDNHQRNGFAIRPVKE